MPRSRFGGRKHQNYGSFPPQEVFPERKIVTFRDFMGGYVSGRNRHLVPENSSPLAFDFDIRQDGRLQRSPGMLPVANLAPRVPSQMALHPTLKETVDLALVAPPEIGFFPGHDIPDEYDYYSQLEPGIQWHDLGLADRGEFAHTTFGGTFFFTDGIRVFSRATSGAPIEEIEDAPVGRTYASFAARIFAGATLIGGRFEPMGIRWSAADSNYKNWDGFGSGFELLTNDLTTGDRIQSIVPMSFDAMAVMLRNSIWYGRFTGQATRPAAFSPRVTGTGAVNRFVSKLSRFGVLFLSDNGVYLFDGNQAEMVSEAINPDLLPLDYENLQKYRALYNPMNKQYYLFTPKGMTFVLDVERQMWFPPRRFTVEDAVMFPNQTDPVRWFELIGDWLNQEGTLWLDYAGVLTGGLRLFGLGDITTEEAGVQRFLAEESLRSFRYFDEFVTSYWETRLFDEQDSSKLVTIKKLIAEYQGQGVVRLYFPDLDNRYVPRLDVELGERSRISTIPINAGSVGKGTGIGVELFPPGSQVTPDGILLPEEPEPEEPDYYYEEPEPEPLDLWVAVASTGTFRSAISENGETWQESNLEGPGEWWSLDYSPELELLVAGDNRTGTVEHRFAISSDGLDWTLVSVPVELRDSRFLNIVWSPELSCFVAIAEAGTARSAISFDGVTWIPTDIHPSTTWAGLAWIPELGRFAACGGVAGNTRYATSLDGINWTNHVPAPSLNRNYRSVAWSPELGYMLMQAPGSGGTSELSLDGENYFQTVVLGTQNFFREAIWHPVHKNFIAVSGASNARQIRISDDGITWATPAAQPGTGFLWSVGYDKAMEDPRSVIVSVSSSLCWTSDDGGNNWTQHVMGITARDWRRVRRL